MVGTLQYNLRGKSPSGRNSTSSLPKYCRIDSFIVCLGVPCIVEIFLNKLLKKSVCPNQPDNFLHFHNSKNLSGWMGHHVGLFGTGPKRSDFRSKPINNSFNSYIVTEIPTFGSNCSYIAPIWRYSVQNSKIALFAISGLLFCRNSRPNHITSHAEVIL